MYCITSQCTMKIIQCLQNQVVQMKESSRDFTDFAATPRAMALCPINRFWTDYVATIGGRRVIGKIRVRSEIWSATSYGELRREGLECERLNRLNPDSARQVPHVEQMLGDDNHPTIAVSDNQIAVPDMIRQWVGGDYVVLGTDGFGRSDTRPALRRFFEIDSQHITLAALSSLVRAGEIDKDVYSKAKKELNVSFDKEDITSL